MIAADKCGSTISTPSPASRHSSSVMAIWVEQVLAGTVGSGGSPATLLFVASMVPADFDPSELRQSEQRVVSAFMDGLPAEWLVLPSVRFKDGGADREIDVLLVCPTRGVLVVEVKGGLVKVSANRWTSYDHEIVNPAQQALENKHGLLRFLRRSPVGTSTFYIDHAIALPDIVCPPEGLAPDAPRRLVIDKVDLDRTLDAVTRMLRENEPVPSERVDAFVKALVPDGTSALTEGDYLAGAATTMDATTAERLSLARSMDANSRVLVSGGAGSGKTWLVCDWAQRAVDRGERTAVVCFNRPMADRLAESLGNAGIVVDSYHNLVVGLLEPYGFAVPPDPDPGWWETEPTEALLEWAREIGTPFDTIIVDEAQDQRPAWLDSLRGLLDPAGPQRLLMVIDPAQAIYTSEWSELVEFFRATLDVNLRNSRAIGKVCERLGGPAPLAASPAGTVPSFRRATGLKELRKQIERTLAQLADDGVSPSEVAVLTTHTATRDALIDAVGSGGQLTRWESRNEGSVLCETIHRTKGLEWAAVVLATLDDPVDPRLLYIGASRPRMHLTFVGPDSLAGAAGVAG